MCLPCLPSLPHSVEFLANTIRFYIICKDYDSINQHSHPSTTTPPTPTGGGAGYHDHPRGGGGAAQGCAIYILINIYINISEHDVVKVAVFPQPPKSLEMLPCNTMPVIPFHFSYYLFLFPSLCRSLRVLFKFICDLQYGNAPCIWPRGGGQKKKKKKIGGFPSRRSQNFFFFFWRPPPPPSLGRPRSH